MIEDVINNTLHKIFIRFVSTLDCIPNTCPAESIAAVTTSIRYPIRKTDKRFAMIKARRPKLKSRF